MQHCCINFNGHLALIGLILTYLFGKHCIVIQFNQFNTHLQVSNIDMEILIWSKEHQQGYLFSAIMGPSPKYFSFLKQIKMCLWYRFSLWPLITLKVHIHFRKYFTAHAVRGKFSVPWKIFLSVYAPLQLIFFILYSWQQQRCSYSHLISSITNWYKKINNCTMRYHCQ